MHVSPSRLEGGSRCQKISFSSIRSLTDDRLGRSTSVTQIRHTPPEHVQRAIEAASEAAALVATPEVTQRLASEGAEPIASTPKDFAAFVRAEIRQWTEVGRAANIQPTE